MKYRGRAKSIISRKIKVVLISLYNPVSLSIRILHSVLKDIDCCEIYSLFFNHSHRRNKFKINVIDKDLDPLFKIILEIDPDLVGISVNSCFVRTAEKITGRLKVGLDSLVIWGGIYPTLHPEESLKYADIICLCEGEESLKELVLRLSQKSNIYDIKGLWFKDNSRIIKNSMRPLIEDLDKIPYPDFSDNNKYYIYGNRILSRVPFYRTTHRLIYHIMTMRDCLYNCSYCVHHLLRKINRRVHTYVRRRSVDNVMQELITIKKYNNKLSHIIFYDDNFTMNKKWLNQFCLQYKKYVNLPFTCTAHPDTIDKEIVLRLKHAGLHTLGIGIQSSPKCSSEIFDRPYSGKKILGLTHSLRKYNIKIVFDIINNNPFENHSEFFEFLSRIPKPYLFNTHELNFFDGYKITLLALSRGMISKHDIVEHQKRIIRWDMFLDLSKDGKQLIWESLYYLIQKRFIPNGILRRLVKCRFCRKCLIVLVPICVFSYHTEKYCKFILQYIKGVFRLLY